MATSITGSGKVIDSRMIWLAGVAERVAGGGVLQADGRGDVAGEHLGDLVTLVGVHLQDAADALALALGAVLHVRAGGQRTGIDPEEGELTDERVVHDLERERRERLAVVRVALELDLRVVDVVPDDGRHVERRREEVDDRVQQLLHALVLERRAVEHRDQAPATVALRIAPRSSSSEISSPSRYFSIRPRRSRRRPRRGWCAAPRPSP
jgi:hypothetical protein